MNLNDGQTILKPEGRYDQFVAYLEQLTDSASAFDKQYAQYQ